MTVYTVHLDFQQCKPDYWIVVLSYPCALQFILFQMWSGYTHVKTFSTLQLSHHWLFFRSWRYPFVKLSYRWPEKKAAHVHLHEPANLLSLMFSVKNLQHCFTLVRLSVQGFPSSMVPIWCHFSCSLFLKHSFLLPKGHVFTSQGAQFSHWADPCLCWADKKNMGGKKRVGESLKKRLHGFVNSWYWPSRFYLIRFTFFRLGLLAAHFYAGCTAACCRTADSMCFHIDYTSGISADANAWVCVCESMCVQRALVRSE